MELQLPALVNLEQFWEKQLIPLYTISCSPPGQPATLYFPSVQISLSVLYDFYVGDLTICDHFLFSMLHTSVWLQQIPLYELNTTFTHPPHWFMGSLGFAF